MPDDAVQIGSAGGAEGEILCEHCHTAYTFDEQRACWSCDGPSCPHCMPAAPEPLCPECQVRGELEGLEPMLATLDRLPDDPAAWAFEYKWDGVRALCLWDGRRPLLHSRNLLNITRRYPELADLGRSLPGRRVVLDGEIVALDENGRPSFPRLQQRIHAVPDARSPLVAQVPVFYFLFDILYLDGQPVYEQPYRQRRELLEGLGLSHPRCRIPPSYPGLGEEMLQTARSHRLEGVVAKRLDSPYEPGRRSRLWRKIKIVHAQAFVVGGWLGRAGDASRLRSLLLGVYDDDGLLHYVGKVGTGFDDRQRQDLIAQLEPLRRTHCPFVQPPPDRDVHYAAPRLVAQVEYRRWPHEAQIHQASFQGLRPDKPAGTVRREEV